MLKVLKVALSWEGYVEKKNNSQLESKKANPGKNNYTIFGKKRGCNGQPWCDGYVDECMVEAYGEEKAKKLLGGFSNYTPTSAQYFKNMGRWHTSNPKSGDQIFFKNSERICHTGLVLEVKNGKVYTIEGNTSHTASNVVERDGGCVAKKSYDLNNSRIAGYGRPDYEGITGERVSGETKSEPVKKKEIKGMDDIATGFSKGDKVSPTTNLNLRNIPTTEGSKVLTILEKGHKCTLKEVKDNWGKVCIIKDNKEHTGWISLKYAKLVK